jgi:hypothetical protein
MGGACSTHATYEKYVHIENVTERNLSIDSGYGRVANSCDTSNEPLGSVKGGEFLDQPSNC